MARSKAKPASHMPKAPWIYISDSDFAHEHASKLASMIPKTIHLKLIRCPAESPELLADIADPRWHDTVIIFSRAGTYQESDDLPQTIKTLKEASIKNGNNFVSIRIHISPPTSRSSLASSHHLEIEAASRTEIASPSKVKITAYAMYKWLFSAFTVLEHLHLIADRQMTAVDRSPAFRDYIYCPISDSRKYSKNAKIQFVALVLDKPVIGPNQRLHWQVADKTGVANFYFHYRGPASQYTWDWVLALRPGDRKCLPRMPMVEIKEPLPLTILKSPLRASAALTTTTGRTFKLAGSGLCKVGAKLNLGNRSEWVPESEHFEGHNKAGVWLRSGLKRRGSAGQVEEEWKGKKYGEVMPAQEKTEVWIFSEKGEKVWRDDDSVASTQAGSVTSEY